MQSPAQPKQAANLLRDSCLFTLVAAQSDEDAVEALREAAHSPRTVVAQSDVDETRDPNNLEILKQTVNEVIDRDEEVLQRVVVLERQPEVCV